MPRRASTRRRAAAGSDSVVITAAAPTNDPLVLATAIARDRGVGRPRRGRADRSCRARRSTTRSSPSASPARTGRAGTTPSTRSAGSTTRSATCAGRSSGTWRRCSTSSAAARSTSRPHRGGRSGRARGGGLCTTDRPGRAAPARRARARLRRHGTPSPSRAVVEVPPATDGAVKQAVAAPVRVGLIGPGSFAVARARPRRSSRPARGSSSSAAAPARRRRPPRERLGFATGRGEREPR